MMTWLNEQGALTPFLEGLLQGAVTTILVSSLAFLIGLGLGVMLLLLRVAGGKIACGLVMVYVSAIRGTPLLIQLMIAYFVLPTLLGITLTPLEAGILALSLNTAAYISEILRGALTSIPRGQVSAAQALGMRAHQKWRYVLLPQVFNRSVPPLTNEYTVLLKASSLLSIIAVSELATLARNATLQSDLPLQVFSATAIVYFLILLCASSISRLIERRIAKVMPNAH